MVFKLKECYWHSRVCVPVIINHIIKNNTKTHHSKDSSSHFPCLPSNKTIFMILSWQFFLLLHAPRTASSHLIQFNHYGFFLLFFIQISHFLGFVVQPLHFISYIFLSLSLAVPSTWFFIELSDERALEIQSNNDRVTVHSEKCCLTYWLWVELLRSMRFPFCSRGVCAKNIENNSTKRPWTVMTDTCSTYLVRQNQKH